MNEILINAKFEALIQQRTIAENAYVNLAGEHAVLQERCRALEARIEALQAEPCHEPGVGEEP